MLYARIRVNYRGYNLTVFIFKITYGKLGRKKKKLFLWILIFATAFNICARLFPPVWLPHDNVRLFLRLLLLLPMPGVHVEIRDDVRTSACSVKQLCVSSHVTRWFFFGFFFFTTKRAFIVYTFVIVIREHSVYSYECAYTVLCPVYRSAGNVCSVVRYDDDKRKRA